MHSSEPATAFRALLSEPAWDRLRAFADVRVFEQGEVLVRRGEVGGVLFVIESGVLDIVDPRTSPATVLDTSTVGEVIGDLSFVDGGAAAADVRAREPTTCLAWDAQALSAELDADPELGKAVFAAIAATVVQRARAITRRAMGGGVWLGPGSTGGGDSRHPEAPGARGSRDSAEPTIRERLALASTRLAGANDLEANSLMASLEGEGVDPLLQVALRVRASGTRRLPLVGGRLTIGRSLNCDLVLPDPRIEPLHAELQNAGDGWRAISRGMRATVVDGAPVSSAPVLEGSVVEVGPYKLTLRGTALEIDPGVRPAAFEAKHFQRMSAGGRKLLNDVSFTALSGEVVALVGPSGSGKTTLLGAISGAVPADSGEAWLGRNEFFRLQARMPSVLGEVPQDDIVLAELTVEESLEFAARIRLPWNAVERQRQVNRVLVELGIEDIRRSRIGDPNRRGISGGQRKRVNLGQELLSSSTRVLFLDEPTSGLDPRAAMEIARVARRLADSGRVVFFVTHDLSAGVMTQVDHLLVMTHGSMAWFGPPTDACAFFGASSPSAIFDRLSDWPAEEWAERYRISDAAKMWCETRSEAAAAYLDELALAEERGPRPLKRFIALLGRYAKVKLRDASGLAVIVAQPAVLALVLAMVFTRPTAPLLFLLTLSCLWFGMSVAVRELISDRTLWERERRVGVRATAWVFSKAYVLGLVVWLQCVLLSTSVYYATGLEAYGFSLWRMVVAAALTGWTGMSLGLLVSAVWRRSEAAVGTIVLLLVPQFAFSGMLMPIEEMNPIARAASWFTPERYAFHLMLRSGEALDYLHLGRWHQRPTTGELFLMGLRPASETSDGMSVQALSLALCLFIVLSLGTAVRALRRS